MRNIYYLCTIIVCTLLMSGCFRGSANLTINEDGSVRSESTLIAVELMQDTIEELKSEVIKRNNNAKIEPYQEGNFSGYKITEEYKTLYDFANNSAPLYGRQNGKVKGISEIKGWFFDVYSFDFLQEGNEKFKDDPDSQAMAKAMLSQVKFDFTVNLPYKADSHNADQASNENKTLYWNLAGALTSDVDKKIQVQFKIWHKKHLIMTGIAACGLLLVTIIFGGMAFKAEEVSEKRGKVIVAGVSLVLLLALGAVSFYFITASPRFTNDTIITPKEAVSEQEIVDIAESRKDTQEQVSDVRGEKINSLSTEVKENPLSLGSVSLGDAESSLSKFGKPDKRTVRDDGRVDYEYADIEVHCKAGRVHTLISNSAMFSTPKGIHEQCSLQDVLSAYGKNYIKSQYENLDLYEYKMVDETGSPCMLRFAINQNNNRVKYISIRHV